MKINSCYSILITLLTISSLQGMQGPKKALKKPAHKDALKQMDYTFEYCTYNNLLPSDDANLSEKQLKELLTQWGSRILHVTITAKRTNLTEALLDSKLIDPNQELPNGKTLLHTAATIEDLPIKLWKILLSHAHAQNSLSQQDDEGYLAFYYVIQAKNLNMIKALIECNAPSYQDVILDAVAVADDDNPDHVEIVRLLCEKYPSSIDAITEQSANIEKALDCALSNNKIKIVKLLLSRGANPKLPDSTEITPLFFAVAESPGCIPWLRKYGADVSQKSKGTADLDYCTVEEGMTPADFARAMHKDGLKDTAWLNAVLQYLDPTRTYKTDSDKMETD